MKKLGEVFTEYLKYIQDTETPKDFEKHNRAMKKICREFKQLNSHMYHTNIFLMKTTVLIHIMNEIANSKSSDIILRSGARSFLRFTDTGIAYPVYTHNGNLGYMVINKNIAATIIPPKGHTDDAMNSKATKLDDVNRECKNKKVYAKVVFTKDIDDYNFDAVTIGSVSSGVYKQKRLDILSSANTKFVVLKYIEFFQLYMNDVLRYVSSLVGIPEIDYDGHIARTHWMEGDSGKPVKRESEDIYERKIRQYTKIFNYVNYIDIFISYKNHNDKNLKNLTICRIHL